MKNNFLCLLLSFIFVFLSLNIFDIQVFAQDLDDVTVSGRITDPNNAPVAGATVTATLSATGAARTVIANDDGRYRIIELAPGTYSIKTTMPGFAAQEKTELVTSAGQNVRLDFALALSSVTAEQTITLDGDHDPVIDPTRTIVGASLTERELEEIPNVSRSPLDLVLTLGGTSEEALSTRDLADDRNANPRATPFEQGNFSLSGGTAYSNNLTIDGLDNNDDRSSRERFQPSLEGIAEVQVITNQFSAEYGRASGGRINLRTRAGANRFRGRVFMFFRDDNLNANTWSNNARGIARLPLTEYNPGFTLSGPVILPFGAGRSIYDGRRRTFFAIAYEYDKFADTTLIDTFVPVAANPRFALPAGNAACPAGLTCLDTNSTPATPVVPYTSRLATPNVNHIFTARFDHKLTAANDLTFGWQLGRKKNRRTSGDSTTRIEDALQAKNNDSDAFNLTDNHVFGTAIVNQMRFQWSRFKPSYQTDDPLAPVLLIGYRSPLTGGTATLIAGNSTAGTLQNFADTRTETRSQVQDSMTVVAGSQTLKFGFDYQRVDSRALALGDATGTFNFASVLSYEQNTLSRFRQNFGTGSDVVNNYFGAFFNDEITLRANLTLSFGLRYEKEAAVRDNNNFGPRFGIAYAPWKNGKGVIRFGAGMFYNRVLLRTVGDYIRNDSGNLFIFDTNAIGTSANDARRGAILAAIANRFPNGYASVAELRNTIAAVDPAFCNSTNALTPCLGFTFNELIRSVDPRIKIPESSQFNVGFEREIAQGLVFEANYTVNKTTHLWREYNPNQPVLPAGYADWTDYLTANPFTFANSNGTVRTYRFYLGSTADGSGLASAPNGTGTCSTTANVTCYVNLNTVNSGTTAPSTAVSGSTTNSIGSPIALALAAIARFRPDPSVEQKERVASLGNSFYHGLIFELRGRRRNLGFGFSSTFRAVYTLSSFQDDGLNNTTDAEIDGDFRREWARNVQDRRHRFALSGTFDTPGWFGKLRFSPLFRYGSPAPFNLGTGSDRNLNDQNTDRLNFSGNLRDIGWRTPGSPFPPALAARFSLPPIGAKGGNLPRNAGRGPSFYTFDLSVTREFEFGERFNLRPVIQFDNILNAAVFSYGSEFINFTALGTTATAAQRANFENGFLVPTRTYRQRQLRLGLRFDF
jgi:hypothetical protein